MSLGDGTRRAIIALLVRLSKDVPSHERSIQSMRTVRGKAPFRQAKERVLSTLRQAHSWKELDLRHDQLKIEEDVYPSEVYASAIYEAVFLM